MKFHTPMLSSARWRFWVELLALLPIDFVVFALSGGSYSPEWVVWSVAAQLLRMVRAPRVYGSFQP